MVNDTKTTIGVIGAGGISINAHLPALRDIEGIHLAAICDVDRKRAAKAAEEFKIPNIYTSYMEMILEKRLDGVFILVQPDQTFRIALDCLNAGLDIFIEKPPGITTYQAETLLSRSRELNRIVQAGFNRRYIPLVKHVCKIMKETTVINQVEGCFFKHGSSAFYDGCGDAFTCDTIHAIDMVRWIADGVPQTAATVQGSKNSELPYAWNSVARFDNGVTGIIKANYQTGGRIHTFEIHGPEASACINLGFGDAGCDARIVFFGGKGTHSISAAGSGEQTVRVIDGFEIAGSKDNYRYYGFFDEDIEFIQCIRTRRQPLASIEEAVRTMHFVDLLRHSAI